MPEPSDAVRDTVRALQVDRVAVEVAAALGAARVPFLLLKGAGTATLLYAGGPGRNYADVDLLVAPAALAPAGRALARAGFACVQDDAAPGAATRIGPHSQVWRRGEDPIEVDLHFTVPGVQRDADAVWAAWSADAVPLHLGDGVVPVPSAAARVLHVALHVWQHRGRHARSRRDLDRALAVVDDDVWRAAAALAGTVGAEHAMAGALRAGAPGAALADRLGLPAQPAPLARLWMADPPAGTIMLARLRAARGPHELASLAAEIVLPPRAILERSAGRRLAGRRAYARAAARRLLAAPRALLPALRAYRAARGAPAEQRPGGER